ncbi:MAG: hypothetical protein BJ554DRAFT_2012 [Olpidium bornovanus]|uniref:IQ motif and ubiquitin-like domain-containing protein n=1 Tax=Olpidium bornovanus TaxID=278681 RepID=A0A8H8DGZ2_9FUNG|nr:MAG: hypothetical protein BJ554DRAFT_2012 [Olpidium bornovanus]
MLAQTTQGTLSPFQRARPKFHRDTQTKFIRNRFSQGVRNSSTQAATRGVYLSSDRDRQITPKVYVTADEHLAMITKKVVSIQCWVRRIYAMRLARHLREEKARKAAELAEKERRRKELAESKRKKEIESRLHPRSSADFDMLYNGLEHWREQEAEKINNAGYPEAARLAALADLMDQEAALIQKIDHLRRAAFAEARERRIFFQLDQMASPKRWAVKGKGHALVDTPTTIRARELRDLYHALALPLLSIDERLQILLHVKYTVKEFDCSLTREIVDLIDREGDLFYLSTTMHHLGKCKQCTIKENVATERKDGSAYINILQNARIAEQSKRNKQLKAAEDNHEGAPGAAADGSPSKPAAAGKSPAAVQKSEQVARTPIMDLLQESDIRYLVDNIWSSQSAISASRRLEDLHLTRWDSNEDLSPWNCILLTKTEAAAHEAQKDPLSVYGEAFIRKVRQKHLAARVHFAQLRDLSRLWQAKVHQQEEEAAAEVDDDRKSSRIFPNSVSGALSRAIKPPQPATAPGTLKFAEPQARSPVTAGHGSRPFSGTEPGNRKAAEPRLGRLLPSFPLPR